MSLASVLDLSVLPPVFLLAAHLDAERRHELEDELTERGAPLTYDINEARLVVGSVNTKRRAEMELRMLKLWTEEVVGGDGGEGRKRGRDACVDSERVLSKRVKLDDSPSTRTREVIVLDDEEGSSTESEPDGEDDKKSSQTLPEDASQDTQHLVELEAPWHVPTIGDRPQDVVFVVKLAWLENAIKENKLLPLDEYIVYVAKPKARPPEASTPKPPPAPAWNNKSQGPTTPANTAARPSLRSSILERAQADAPSPNFKQPYKPASTMPGRRRFGDHGHHHHASSKEKAKLLQQTTSDYDSGVEEMPPPPDWVRREVKYACMRRTPGAPANGAFVGELKRIRRARELQGDEVGVRAYSTAIAAVAAYPHVVGHARQILALPGCDVKVANLWVEWRNAGVIREAEDAERDEAMRVLRDFYDIWGVGATTAREFYYERGWRDRDDVVEYGWGTLTRVQQIGLKYYDEFKLGIPRAEVEAIAAVVKEHATRVRDTGVEVLVVGGYRRGKAESGDVDIIVSHRQLDKTANLVTDIVASLEADEWITHTLLLSLTGTHRGQATLPFKGIAPAGHGFDTLDKALVVWQDPAWPGGSKPGTAASSKSSSRSSSRMRQQEEHERRKEEEQRRHEERKKNPNPHRRVDIIVSPWRTVGCAVTGWSGGTTFQRDLRRYAKHAKGWKFDSSGVRDRRSGLAVDLEGPEGVGDGLGMLDAEKKVFAGLGLEWIPPEERCTG